ncbi:TetR/AcrR family transcriptional regulator [Oenococcus sp.]|uniref:TetR/AcrR family transcriptional regulator n=1 Tax=Oenococcus sp. TaxID=1979414 RepID=UPI0039EABF86
MSGKREKNKSQQRDKILQAAYAVFNRTGYQAAKVSQIAQTAHVSQVTLYKYFASKRLLFKALLKDLIQRELANMKQALSDLSVDQPQNFLKVIQFSQQETQEFSKMFFEDVVAEYQGQNGDHEIYDYYEQELTVFWQYMIAQVRSSGYIASRISDQSLMLYFKIWTSYFADPKNSRWAQGIDLKTWVTQLTDLFYFGLLNVNDDKRQEMLKDLYEN